jgi:hypothetical protein
MKTAIKKVLGSIMLGTIIGAMVGISYGVIYAMHEKEYEKTALNPPSINFVEEDLETVFMTTNVVVYDTNHEYNDFYCKVEANGFNYKVRYSVCCQYIMSFTWKYQNHIMINE